MLTMPLMRGADVTDAIARINEAFRLLTNRLFWKSRVAGGVKSVEFTVRPEGFHVHIHLLVLADFIPVDAKWEQKMAAYMTRRNLAIGNLQSEMKHCLRAVGSEVLGDVVVFVKDVRRRGERDNPHLVSLDKALMETCKYLTKSESWDKIPDEQLVKVAEVERWPRMFELLGAARCGKAKAPEASDNKTEAVQGGEASTSSIYHHGLSTSDDELKGDGKRPRSQTWRRLLVALSWDEWVGEMRRRIQRAQAYRKAQLAEKFPFARFKTLAGEMWGFGLEESLAA